MSTKHVTCRYFIHGVCREGNRCLFSHDLANSKPSSICRFYQKGQCAYGSRCRYDHVKPTSSPMVYYPQDVPAASVEAPPASSLTVEAPPVVTKTTPHKREKKSIVLRDRDLCGQTEEKSRVDPISNPQSCSDAQGADQVLKPHSYLEAICTGLEEVEMAAPYLDTPHQPCPYAAAGTCHFGETCVYIHGDMCEICNLQVLHPYDQEQRKSHEKVRESPCPQCQ